MEKRLDKAERELLRELTLIKVELEHRSVPAAKALQRRVTRVMDFFVAGSYQAK